MKGVSFPSPSHDLLTCRHHLLHLYHTHRWPSSPSASCPQTCPWRCTSHRSCCPGQRLRNYGDTEQENQPRITHSIKATNSSRHGQLKTWKLPLPPHRMKPPFLKLNNALVCTSQLSQHHLQVLKTSHQAPPTTLLSLGTGHSDCCSNISHHIVLIRHSHCPLQT